MFSTSKSAAFITMHAAPNPRSGLGREHDWVNPQFRSSTVAVRPLRQT